MPDAIVIGAGPNGLVAANLLADEGWSVTVLEAESQPGGAVRSSELIEPGFINDHFSAFYPLGAGSPVMKSLELEKYGLEWLRSPLVLAHPASDGTCPTLSMDIDETVSGLEQFAPGDGDSWRRMYDLWKYQSDDIIDALFTPFPPIRIGLRLARSMEYKELIRFARFAILPTRRLGEELFDAEESRRLFAGMALHADLLPESTMGAFYGWMLSMLGHTVGWPVPKGGAGELTAALVRRLEAKGGTVRCSTRVSEVVVRHGKAVGVRDTENNTYDAHRAVLADVDAPTLYLSMIPSSMLSADVERDIKRFEWDFGTFKLDWTLNNPIPWTASEAKRAGTVHLIDSVDQLSITTSELSRGLIPSTPFLLMGQQSMTDPSRAPEGKETAWAYTHVPFRVKGDAGGSITGTWDESERNQMTERVEAEVEKLAPGFTDSIRGRHVASPLHLQDQDSNLKKGALGGGTAQLHQQLVFRPIPGLGRPETPVPGLYLASSSAHPGGGVHGACGANAAKAVLTADKHKVFKRAVGWAARRASHKGAPPVP